MNRRDALKLTATAAPALAQQSTVPAWKPRLFDQHQADTVATLAERIIPATDTPGAMAAGVHRYIDTLLADGENTQRVRFLEGLAWLDGVSHRDHSAPFVRLPVDKQNSVLEGLAGSSGPGEAFFRLAKQLTVRVYYATQTGFNELNKGGRAAGFGCKHPEHA